LAWPHTDTDWHENLEAIERTYVILIATITRYEKVVLLVADSELRETVRDKLASYAIDLAQVVFVIVPYDDTWLRDTGPLSVVKGDQIELHDFRFNGWGGKYDAHQDDNICQALADEKIFPTAVFVRHQLIMEGGSIDFDGVGTLLTTRQCLLSTTRNPEMQDKDYEAFFERTFGVRQVHWIEHSKLIGDDTDGHIDMLARFCDQGTIAYSSCNDENDPQFGVLSGLADELAELRSPDNHSYDLVPLPVPTALFNSSGQRLPASYANFLVINDAVLVPVYNDKNDQAALQSLMKCFPGREVIGIDASAIIEQFGSLHCLTMQLPAGVLKT
jgi:agmatine deiminase